MDFRIKVLSPVHIGCGESYSGLNYVLDKGKLYYIDPDNVLKCLNGKQDVFVKWIDENSDNIDVLDESRRRARSKEEGKNFASRLRSVKKRFNLNEFCQKNGIDIIPFKNTSTYVLRGKGKYFKSIDRDIEKFISQMNKPYIPGTEIKGAIRTAVLYKLFKDNDSHLEEMKRELEKYRSDNSDKIDAVKNLSFQ